MPIALLCLVLSCLHLTKAATIYTSIAKNGTTCSDSTCRKDLYGGQYVNCPGKGSFTAIQNVGSDAACYALCVNETGCGLFTYYNFGVGSGACNLFITSSCTTEQGQNTNGNFYQMFTNIYIDNYYTCSDSVCRKDLYAGEYVNCPGGGSFSPNYYVNSDSACAELCVLEPGCNFFTDYNFGSGYGACNLFITSTCSVGSSGAAGDLYYRGVGKSAPFISNDETVKGGSVNDIGGNPNNSAIIGLSAGLGVAALVIVALLIAIVVLVKTRRGNSGQLTASMLD